MLQNRAPDSCSAPHAAHARDTEGVYSGADDTPSDAVDALLAKELTLEVPGGGASRDSSTADGVVGSDGNLLSVHALEQASHGGELAAGVSAGLVTRKRVTEIGHVLAGEADGRRSAEDITLFDSTGLAIQDLVIARVAAAKIGEFDLVQLAL